MLAVLPSVSALLLGIGVLLLGNGLQGTLLGVRAGMEGFPTQVIGLVMSAYFAGFVAGSLYVPALVRRSGHIRTFAALASVASAAPLLHALYVAPFSWALLRVVTGFCFAGLFMVAESWLNDRATNETRGNILSVYMIVNLSALAIGQQFLTLADPADYQLFALSSVLVSVALVPVALTRSAAPVPIKPKRFGLKRLHAVSPLGVIGALGSGLIQGAFWGMSPVFGQAIGLSTAGIASFISLTVLGGIVLQWPIGRLSDVFDRRTVITVVCFALAGASLALGLSAAGDRRWMYPIAVLYGGLSFPLYSLCIAHANDFLAADERVPASSGLLLTYGVGAGLGPLAAGQVMEALGAPALFYYTPAIAALLGLFALYRMTRRSAPPAERQGSYVALPAKATAAVLGLTPRAAPEPAAPAVGVPAPAAA
ncbi:MAG TPA: MFS transporter, partial [Geminicoccaceae bacterium]|nr:MFS transporter [Geminicoccaceae bacterium]